MTTLPPFQGPPVIPPDAVFPPQPPIESIPAFSSPLFSPPSVSPPGSIFDPGPTTLPGSILPLSPTPTDTPPDPSTVPSSLPSTSPTPSVTDTGGEPFPQTSSTMSTTITTTPVAVPTSPQPVSAASTEHNHHAGAIVGGVIGGLALLVALIAVFIFYRSRTHGGIPARLRRHRRGTFGSGSGTFKKWDGLGSHDYDYGHGSTLPAYSASNPNAPSRHPSTGSGAYMLSGHTNSIGHSYYEDEKTPPASSHGHEPLEPLPYTQYAFDVPPASLPAAAAFPPGRPRERSATLDCAPASPTSPWFNNNRQSLDGRMLASPPMSPTAALHFQQGESVEMKRRSSSTRRMQRKAVPKYDESEFEGEASVSRSASMSAPAATATVPPRTPTPPHAVADDSSAKAVVGSGSRGSSSSNLHDHDGSTTLHEHEHDDQSRVSKTRDELLAAGYTIPRLTEKASWGDMHNVHYLIPDMPAPQVD